jgi:hypothetical protein
MSLPQTSPFPASVFLERLLRFLIPYFADVTQDLSIARAEVLETLAAYGARTRAELLCAAQVIAFSFASLDTLAESNASDLSSAKRIRFRGCANSLNRSSQKTEQILSRRLAHDIPSATIEQEPINDIPDPEADAILEQTLAEIDAHRSRAAASHPATNRPSAQASNLNQRPLSQQEQNKRLWGAAMINVLAEMGMPVQLTPPKETRPTNSG